MRILPILVGLVIVATPALALVSQPEDRSVLLLAGTFKDEKDGGTVTRIKAGSSVTWTWAVGTHSVTSGAVSHALLPPAFDSGLQDTAFDPITKEPITKFTVTFDKPGVYPYFCKPHTLMRGTVIVEP